MLFKDSLYDFFVRKNQYIRYEYERYVQEHLEEHRTHRLRHIRILCKLNWFYRVKKNTPPCIYMEPPVSLVENNSNSDIDIIRNSNYFDEKWYVGHYPDTENNPAEHYYNIGWKQYYSPGPSFSTLLYLNRYDDVREEGINPLLHYETVGKQEKRISSYKGLLKTISKEIELIENSIFWDSEFYEKTYLNDKFYIESASVHYFCIGCYTGKEPSRYFSHERYEKLFSKVNDNPIPALLHYELIGKFSGIFNGSTAYYQNKKTIATMERGIYGLLFELFNNYTKKKILLVSHIMNRTGAPKVLVDMAIILKNLGYYPVVGFVKGGELINQLKEFEIDYVLLPEYEDNKLEKTIINFVNLFDCILFNTIESLSLAHIVRYTKPYKIGWMHEGNMTLESVSQRKISRIYFLDKVFACSDYSRRCFEQYIDSKKIDILHYGIDLHEVVDMASFIHGEKFTIIVVGTIGYRKSTDIILSAIDLLPQSLLDEIEIWLVGDVVDNEIGNILNKYLKQYQNLKHFGSLNYTSTIDKISQSNLLICPSRDDPMPVVVTEAFALKVPVLVSRKVGTSDLIDDGINGYIINELSASSVADKLVELYSIRDSLKEVGEKGFEIYKDNFSYESYEKNIIQVFNTPEIKNVSNIIEENISNIVLLRNIRMTSRGVRLYFTCSIDNRLSAYSKGKIYTEFEYDEKADLNLDLYLHTLNQRLAIIDIETDDLSSLNCSVISEYFDGIRLDYGEYVWSNLKYFYDTYGICVIISDYNIAFCRIDYFISKLLYSKFCSEGIRNQFKQIKNIKEQNKYSVYVETRDNANDNSFQLFKYELKFNDDCYFITNDNVINHEKDERIKEHMLVLNSDRAKDIILRSKYIVCSWYQVQLYGSPNMRWLYPFIDLKYIFVPHGISYDKTSFYLNTNVWGYFHKCIVSSCLEKRYMKSENGYLNVEVLGYPRMDKWNNSNDGSVLVFPTWRKKISKEYIDSLMDAFDILANKQVVYIAHPSIDYVDYEKICSRIQSKYNNVKTCHSSDSELFNRYFQNAKFLITDYSSVAYDFAYKGGISIYYEPFMKLVPNYEILPDFYDHHCGVIVNSVQMIKDIITDDSYEVDKQRQESFFLYRDNENCKRVWDYINERNT